MTWEDTIKKSPFRDRTRYLGLNSIVDIIARIKENISEMEAMTRESFATTAEDRNIEFDTEEAKDILSDFNKFSEVLKTEWQKLIERGEVQ